MKQRDESILVLPRVLIDQALALPATPGVTVLDEAQQQQFEALVLQEGVFLPRSAMEVDPAYKQIIPYFVFVHNDRIFVMQRSNQAGEQRLAGAYTIGIGGHVRKTDWDAGPSIRAWGMREFAEEVAYRGTIERVVPFGVVNDDSNLVGQVHIGFVYVLHGSSNAIAVHSELASGQLMSRAEALALRDRMETWSQLVLDALLLL